MSSAYHRILAAEREEAKKHLLAWQAMSRHRSEVFAEYVMRDETGNRFINAEHHNRLHEALGTLKKLIVMWPPEFGKTEQLQALTLHILGRSTDREFQDSPPLYRGAFIKESFTNASKSLRVIKQYIQESEDFQAIWPGCKPAKGEAELWSREAINILRPPSVKLKDPSLQALGARGPILGSRLDFAICDDILTWENTRTQDQRDQMYEWFKSTVLTRINEWGIIVLLVNAWHPNDLAHRLVDEGWPILREPCFDSDKVPLWEARWPLKRCEEKIVELGPIEGPRKMLHKARSESDMRFTTEMVGVATTRGSGIELLDSVRPADGYRTYTGVDLGIARTKRRAGGRATSETSMVTILVHPSKVRQVIDMETGRWDAPTIMEKAVQKHRQYESILMVENNSAQDLFVQLMQMYYPVPIEPYTTTGAAAHPEFGMEKIGVEMKQGLWIFPADRARRTFGEVYQLIQEMYDYRPGQHVGDRLRALMFAWEGARRSESTVKATRLRLLNR